MIAKCLSFLLLLMFPSFSGQSTYPTPGPGRNAYTSSSTYTYSQWAYVAGLSNSTTSITSNAVVVSAGDFAFQFCRGGGTPSSVTANSTPVSTVNALPLTLWAGSAAYLESFWYPSLSAGSTTFTCTTPVSEAYQSMTVVIYHYSGPGPSILSASTTTGACGVGTDCTSSSFNTSSAALVIDCTTQTYTTWIAALIGSNTSTLRAVSQSSLSASNPDSGCEDTQFSTAQSSITATIHSYTSGYLGYTVAAFN